MFGWTNFCLLAASVGLAVAGLLPRLRALRTLCWGLGVLVLLTALFPRPGNPLGEYLFAGLIGSSQLPLELLGVAWWVLGAWLLTRLLDLVLRRTLFPDDNQPHGRRLFADLAAGLIYVVAFVGIVDTVLKEPVSAVLATSGVLAIVLGLALQNTLSDVFSGLAINIERPYGAGDWITVPGGVEGQVVEVNWRATHIRTLQNDVTVVPNSVMAKAMVTNHRRWSASHRCAIEVRVDQGVPPPRVIEVLLAAAAASPVLSPGSPPTAYLIRFDDGVLAYELDVPITDFGRTLEVRSDVMTRVAQALSAAGIDLGAPATELRMLGPAPQPPRAIDLLRYGGAPTAAAVSRSNPGCAASAPSGQDSPHVRLPSG